MKSDQQICNLNEIGNAASPLLHLPYWPINKTFSREYLHTYISTCALHDSSLIRFVVQYGALYAHSRSILGQNVLFCTQRYHRSINDVIYNQVNSFINSFAYNSVDCETHLAANLLTEAFMLRDHVYCFSNGFSLSHDELRIL